MSPQTNPGQFEDSKFGDSIDGIVFDAEPLEIMPVNVPEKKRNTKKNYIAVGLLTATLAVFGFTGKFEGMQRLQGWRYDPATDKYSCVFDAQPESMRLLRSNPQPDFIAAIRGEGGFSGYPLDANGKPMEISKAYRVERPFRLAPYKAIKLK